MNNSDNKDSVKSNVKVSVGSLLLTTFINFTFPYIFIQNFGSVSYGYWLAINAVPSMIVLAELGLANPLAASMANFFALGHQVSGRIVFAQVRSRIIKVMIFACPILVLLTTFFFENKREVAFVSLAIAVSASLGVLNSINEAGFRSLGFYQRGIYWLNLTKVLEFALMSILILFGNDLVLVAIAGVTAKIIGNFLMTKSLLRILRSNPDFHETFQYSDAQRKITPITFGPSMGVNGATILQGQLVILIIHMLLGSQSVTAFSLARTIFGSVKQLITATSSGFTATVNVLLSSFDFRNIRLLMKSHNRYNYVYMLVFCPLLFVSYPTVLRIWTSGEIKLTPAIALLFILEVIAFSSFSRNLSILAGVNFLKLVSFSYILLNAVALLFIFLVVKPFGFWTIPLAYTIVFTTMTYISGKQINLYLVSREDGE